jgi:Acyl-CoA synthetases (AMP-forming)/AMP-acid ligases II
VDEEGYYYMTGRKKNLIIPDSGEHVSPEELEKLQGKCEAIKECIVKEMGKKIGTVVCCEEDKQQQVKAFVTELNRTQPLYKRISVVECSAEPLPRNALGKLLRK